MSHSHRLSMIWLLSKLGSKRTQWSDAKTWHNWTVPETIRPSFYSATICFVLIWLIELERQEPLISVWLGFLFTGRRWRARQGRHWELDSRCGSSQGRCAPTASAVRKRRAYPTARELECSLVSVSLKSNWSIFISSTWKFPLTRSRHAFPKFNWPR